MINLATREVAGAPTPISDFDVEKLDSELAEASAHDIVRIARDLVGRERLALVSSFGAESAALLKIVADVDPAIPVVFLDTGWLFEETLAYRDRLGEWLGLRDVRTIKPDPQALKQQDEAGDLWFSNPDACCRIRKIEPLARALAPFDAWLNGRKRYQGGGRTAIPVVEKDGARLKFNPLAHIRPDEIRQIVDEANLPPHPLVAAGFVSIGCMPCTSRAEPGEDPRAGRWRGRGKTECGIHIAEEPIAGSTKNSPQR